MGFTAKKESTKQQRKRKRTPPKQTTPEGELSPGEKKKRMCTIEEKEVRRVESMRPCSVVTSRRARDTNRVKL